MRCFINLIFIRLLLLLDKKGCVHGHTSFVTCKIKCSYVQYAIYPIFGVL